MSHFFCLKISSVKFVYSVLFKLSESKDEWVAGGRGVKPSVTLPCPHLVIVISISESLVRQSPTCLTAHSRETTRHLLEPYILGTYFSLSSSPDRTVDCKICLGLTIVDKLSNEPMIISVRCFLTEICCRQIDRQH